MRNGSKKNEQFTIIWHEYKCFPKFKVVWGFQGDSNHVRLGWGRGRNPGRMAVKRILEMALEDRIEFQQS